MTLKHQRAREVGSAMADSGFWFGYLTAGKKSSAVLRDPDLDTGNQETVFLFNLERNTVIEYKREIVDAKLRELTAKESDLIAALKQAYADARETLPDRPDHSADIPDKIEAPLTPDPVDEVVVEDDMDADDVFDDMDLVDDEEP